MICYQAACTPTAFFAGNDSNRSTEYEGRCITLQANSPPRLCQVLTAHAAKISIVENQVAELRTLPNEIDLGKALDLVVKSVKTNEFAQYDSRVVETEGLIEIASE